MTEAELNQALLEKQRARKRINRKRFYAKNKGNPEFMAKQYAYISRHRAKKKLVQNTRVEIK